MYVGFTTLSASHLNIVNGAADGNSGGGMFVLSSTVSLDDIGISGNSSDYAAGIAAFNYSKLTIMSSTISGNVAARKGGALEIVNGTTVQLENTVVSGNSASRGAGVFLSFYSQLSLARSTISGNTASSGPNVSGGGIYGYRCTKIKLTDSTVAANTGNYRGGGIVAVECPLALVNSTVAANTSLANGGGIYIEHGAGTLVNATISANSGQDAGGIFVYKGSLTLANTILSANTASAPVNPDLDLAQSTASAQYSLLGSLLEADGFADPGNHNLFTDSPGLGPLQDNGGATWTMALLPGSPAIDAGSNALAQDGSQALDADQRAGFPRMVDAAVDIGAFEYQPDRIFATSFEQLP
jgi:hypothetical protein